MDGRLYFILGMICLENLELHDIYKPDSGWMDEELEMLSIINDYNYMLPS